MQLYDKFVISNVEPRDTQVLWIQRDGDGATLKAFIDGKWRVVDNDPDLSDYLTIEAFNEYMANYPTKDEVLPAPEQSGNEGEYVSLEDGEPVWKTITTNEVLDQSKNKTQSEINAEYASAIAGLNSQNYVTVDTYGDLPSTGSQDAAYRVCNWDGAYNSGEGQVDSTKYTEYAWTGSDYLLLSVKSGVEEVFNVSQYNASGGSYATYESLADLLTNHLADIPVARRKGGMSVKFIQGTAQSSDNKYVQFRYMSSSTAVADFTNAANWQGVDDEPTAGSKNLVKSGGVYTAIESVGSEIGLITISYLAGRLKKYVNAEANTNYLIEFKSCTNENITNVLVYAYDDSSSLGLLGTVNVNGKLSVTTPTGTTRLYLYNSTQVSVATTAVFKITDDIKADLDDVETQISNLQTSIENKVDKVTGKGLSTNDFTDAYKENIDELMGLSVTETYTFAANKRLSKFITAEANKRYKITFNCDNSEWASARFIAEDNSGSLDVEVTINRNSSGYLETPSGTTRILAYNGTSATAQQTNVTIILALEGIVDELDAKVDELDAKVDELDTSVKNLEASNILDKKIMVLGDSLSEFDTYDSEEGKSMTWTDYATNMGGTFIKGACGGSRLTARAAATDSPADNTEKKGNLDISNLCDSWINQHWTGVDISVATLGHETSITNLKNNALASVDAVVVMGGYNDVFSKISLGTVNDTDKLASASGALYTIIANLLTASPKLKIFFVIEPPFYYGSTLENRVDEQWSDVQYSTYNTGIEYRNAMAAVCEKMRVPYLDLYYKCGWNKVNFPTIYGTGANDDNHHPRYGWKLIAEKVHSFVIANW